MHELVDVHKQILKEEYPNINFESDSDIERYFELRQIGRQQDALFLYNTRLKRKYPDEKQRTTLMRYFRSHNPAFHALYRENLAALAERLLFRTYKIIEILTKEIDTVNIKDAYAVIKLAEGLLGIISPDRYQAIAFTEKYVRYANLLNFRTQQMERVSELLRLYVTDTLESVQEYKKVTEIRQKEKILRQKKQRQKPAFDLSKIIFSKKDIARICIPSNITRIEDVVIAYCLHYWSLVNDPTFEKTVFLYSRKYRTHQYEIFQAIKNGRDHGWKDEEILNAVLSNVVTGYYYSISGDIYLQRTWMRYKASLSDQKIVVRPHIKQIKKSLKPAQRKKRRIKIIHNAVSVPKTAKSISQRPQIKGLQKSAPVSTKTFKPTKQKTEPMVIPRTPSFVPNSIADIIRRLTGKSYTVYKEIFFKTIRPAIRKTLSATGTKRNRLFDDKQNKAEEIIYKFLFIHYNDPYQNWKDSSARENVIQLGYNLAEIEPIIVRWIKDNH